MKDFIKKYQNHKLLSNINIVLASLVIALWINFFILDWTDIWKSIKTSVLNADIWVETADISIQKIDNDFFIVANKNISNMNSLSLGIIYNPENITISELSSDIWEVSNIWNTPWNNSIIIIANKTQNIKNWDKLMKIVANKKNETSENINLINANFTDSEKQQYLLSTSGITF